jgi:hypothetical protein
MRPVQTKLSQHIRALRSWNVLFAIQSVNIGYIHIERWTRSFNVFRMKGVKKISNANIIGTNESIISHSNNQFFTY